MTTTRTVRRWCTLSTEITTSLTAARRVVVKIGSALLTDPADGLARAQIATLCEQIAALKDAGREVILVSSGAVAEGCARLGWVERPGTVHELQAAAAVGQMGLAQAYEAAFLEHGRASAMIMLTHDDLADRQRYLNARATLNQLLALGVVPVINENDTVATDEIRFGDNDSLAALVANLLQADLLVILTDVPGLMNKDPSAHADASLVPVAQAGDPALEALAGKAPGVLGRGGMITKLQAAKLAARSGAHTIIANGRKDAVLTELVAGTCHGTLLTAELNPMTARKRWIAGHLRAKGTLDAGAARARKEKGVSLLAVGLVSVSGLFGRGDVVRIRDADGRDVAQGLCNYGHADTLKLRGVRSEDFAQHIEFVGEPELVHRDNLVLL